MSKEDFDFEWEHSLSEFSLRATSLQQYETALMVGHVGGGFTLSTRQPTDEEIELSIQIAENLYELGYHPPIQAGERVYVNRVGTRREWGLVTGEQVDGAFLFLLDARDSRGQSEGVWQQRELHRDPLSDPLRTIPGYDPTDWRIVRGDS